jgi:hypothetical protein
MHSCVPSPRRPRAGAASLLVAATLALAAGGCGGSGSDGPSKQGYVGTINTFCTDVKSAAAKVSTDATKLQGNATKNPQQAVKGFGTTLQTFADSTQKALDQLRKADVPSDYKSFNDKAVAAFGGVVGKLHSAADGAKKGNLAALSSLGADLGAVKLPNLPPDISKNAKACADISG